MALHLPTFYKRAASAVVFAAIMLVGLLWDAWAFLALAITIQTLCLRDYMRLMKKITPANYWPGWLPVAVQITALLILIPAFLLKHGLGGHYVGGQYIGGQYIAWPAAFWALLPVAPAGFFLAAALGRRECLPAMLQAVGGILYIALPISLLQLMYLWDYTLPIALILMIWTNDTMAYMVGSFIGKTPFSPISPKKTWEGTIGGAILTMAGAGAYGYFAHSYAFTDWMALALCAAVAGTMGDLLESKLKRMADVKDSGTLMPGHGGALDRFDSLLVAAPFAFVYVAYVMR